MTLPLALARWRTLDAPFATLLRHEEPRPPMSKIGHSALQRNGNIILHLRFDAQAEVSSFGFLVSSFWVSGYDNAQQVQCGRFLVRPSQA